MAKAEKSESQPQTKSGKLPVAEPASFSKFFLVLAMHVCKRVLIIDTKHLAIFYICSVTIVSLLTDLFPFPKTYLADKNHFWNQYFVKLGLAWTLVCLGPFIYFTSFVVSLGKTKVVYRHMARLLLLYASWFFVTSIIGVLERQYSYCKGSSDFKTEDSCKKNNGVWTKWLDISGHGFLLVLCILTITEEAIVFRDWSKLDEILRKEDKNYFCKLSQPEIDKVKELYKKYTPLVRVSLVVLCILQLIWNMMLLGTVLYFHQMPDKFLGVTVGILCWLINYHVVCKMENSLPAPFDLMKKPFTSLKEA